MAHIIYRRQHGGEQIIINGVDYSMETYSGVELVQVGEHPFAEVGLRVTFSVGRLDVDGETDIQVTDQFPTVAQKVRSISEESA